MARAPAALFRREDFPDLQGQDQLDRFFRTLNAFTEQTKSALAKGLTIADNSAAFVKTLTVTTGSPWIAPALLNSFANLGSGFSIAGYFKDSVGAVHLRGVVSNAPGVAAATPIFTLPAGYRPAYRLVFPGNTGTASGGRIDVDVLGNVFSTFAVSAGDFRTLDGIAFLAEPGGPGPSLLSTALRFKNDLATKPAGVTVWAAQDVTASPAIPVALGGVAWATSQDQIVISDIAGLAPSRTYKVTFLVLGG